MTFEDAAVHERHRAHHRGGVIVAVGLLTIPETVVEQRQQKALEEGVGAFPVHGAGQPRSQVSLIAVQEPLVLNEVAEHQAVQDQRGVPTPVAGVTYATDRLAETPVVPLELPVEAAGDLLGIERAPYPFQHRSRCQRGLLGNRERCPLKSLQDRLGRGVDGIAVGHQAVAHPTGPLLRPQPQALIGRGEHHQLIPAHTAQLPNQAILAGPQRQTAGTVDPERGHALLFGHRCGCQSAVGDADRIVVPRMVPAHLPNEQTREVTRRRRSRSRSVLGMFCFSLSEAGVERLQPRRRANLHSGRRARSPASLVVDSWPSCVGGYLNSGRCAMIFVDTSVRAHRPACVEGPFNSGRWACLWPTGYRNLRSETFSPPTAPPRTHSPLISE